MALAVALAVLSLCVSAHPLYMINDDAALAMVGAGFGIAAHPEAHLVFAHYGYGVLVGAVARVVGPAAHGWITLASLVLCLALLIKAVLQVHLPAFWTTASLDGAATPVDPRSCPASTAR